jgi:hypothetical protein
MNHSAADAAMPSGTAAAVPLCVDLDGTLLRTDTLVEGLMRLLKTNVTALLSALVALFRGRAAFKAKVAEHADVNVALLPENDEFTGWLREQHASGRSLVLCTAADQRVADQVARRYEFFSRVLGSAGGTNLSGGTKAAHFGGGIRRKWASTTPATS